MPRPSATLTTQELAIMKVIWRAGSGTVREVYETLRTKRRIAYTTVLTMMNILESKGFLKKAPDGRAYRYRPTHPERRVLTAMVREFVDRVFDGTSAPLLAQLARDSRLSKAERAELRRLIDEMDA
jgi:predicted transcriptional regulator